MRNLRLIYDNCADRAVSLTASSTAGNLDTANLLNDFKGQVHRSVGLSVSYTITWGDVEQIGGVALPATNLSASATVRVRLYSDTVGSGLLADSGVIPACPGLNLGYGDWSRPRNSNAFALGGASKTSVWFESHHAARRCVIDLVDAGNTAGYIDCARLVLGSYWQPFYNASYGAQVNLVDTSGISRNDAGDLLVDRKARHDAMSFSLTQMPEADRARLMQILRNAGTSRNLFISLLPAGFSAVAEQDSMIFGKRRDGAITFDFYNAFSSKFDVDGW